MKRRETPLTCHYCGREGLRHNFQMDHFPVPKCCGGTRTVPACVLCHDDKDRRAWESLPWKYLQAVNITLLLPYEADRLQARPHEEPDDWADWPTESRVIWARMSRVLQQRAAVGLHTNLPTSEAFA